MTLSSEEVFYVVLESLQEFKEDFYVEDKLSSISLTSQLATWYLVVSHISDHNKLVLNTRGFD